MIRGLVIRPAESEDAGEIRGLLALAFETADEAVLVESLRRSDDRVLELVATHEGALVGEIFFSRLRIVGEESHFDALALGPLAVAPERQRTGIGTALVENAHHMLREGGESLSVVLGDPAYYGRFGYAHGRAAGFESKYQSEFLQALAWGETPATGELRYPPAFAGL
jgi:putative acetyltransferase